MKAAFSEQSPLPLYHRLYLTLREKIAGGGWERGSFLPGENELAATFGVSRVTVRRALALLESENLVRRSQGRGTIVSPSLQSRPVAASMGGHIDSAVTLASQTAVELLEFGTVEADEEIAELLDLQPGARVHRNVRVRRFKGIPVSQITTYLPGSAKFLRKEHLLSSTPILSLIEKRIELESAEQQIGATLVDEKLAASMRLPIGSPLLDVRRIVFATGHVPVMRSISKYNPEIYEIRFMLEPSGTPGSNLYD